MEKLNPKKSAKLEAKGDKLVNKGKYQRAIKKYKKALKYNDENAALYEKLISTKDQISGDWDKKEFSESLDWLMKKQEIENPRLKHVHDRLTPEWETVSKLIAELLDSKPDDEDKIISKIRDYRETAVQPLIDFILSLKESMDKNQGTGD
jgi:tetratricopeptide (TPR) repeat protein